MEHIGEKCFCGSWIEEISLPSTLMEMAEDVIPDRLCLRRIRLEEGCTVDLGKYVHGEVEMRRE